MSEESQRCDDTLESLPEWLRESFQQKHEIDFTAENISGTPEGVDESALLIHAGEKRKRKRFFEAIDIYIQVIKLQLQRHDLGESSPSREAFERIFEILGYDSEPMWAFDWWRKDISTMTDGTLPHIVSRTIWPLSSGTMDVFQTLADYVTKWYAPDGLTCAEVLYRRILIELGYKSLVMRDKRRAHVVKELAKIYVEVPKYFEWSSATTSIVQQGLQEVKKNSGDDELMQFYQGLGALYTSKDPEDASFDARYGEEILQCLYEIQKQVFGYSDYRSVKTVNVLSRYYQRTGREVQAASLIECTLREGDTTADSDCCLLKRLERHLGRRWDGGSGNPDVEGAGDERKSEAIKKARKLKKVRDTTAATSDGRFNSIYRRKSLQSRLMLLLAPSWRAWEDSRLYLNDIAEVRFQPVAFTNTLEHYPARVVFRNNEVSVHISSAARSLLSTSEDNKRVSELVKWVQESSFCQNLKTADDSWKPNDEHESTEPDSSSQKTIPEDSNAKESDLKPDMTAWDTDSVFWIFPRDLAAVEKQSVQWKYTYHKLPNRPGWMVVAKWPANQGPLRKHRSSYYLPCFPGDDFAYSINEQEDSSVTLVCAYIPYREVQKLRGFIGGLTYADFTYQLHLSPQHQDDAQRILEFKKTLCKQDAAELQELPIVILDNACHTSPKIQNNREGGCSQSIRIGDSRTDGFFNNIPGDFAVTHYEDQIRGFNLVSSSWVDWKAFAVHNELLDHDCPKLTSEVGDPINCLGIIRGTWMTGRLDGKFAMDKVFVIDAIFKSTKEPQLLPNFIFCQDALAESSITHLSSVEKRSLIGKLNPSFFRYWDLPEEPSLGGSWRSRKPKPPQNNFDDCLMAEVQRRKERDRDYEEQKELNKNDSAMMQKIEQEQKLEHERRAKWDSDVMLIKQNLRSI